MPCYRCGVRQTDPERGKGEYRKELAEYLKKGFQRVKIDGTFPEIASAPARVRSEPVSGAACGVTSWCWSALAARNRGTGRLTSSPAAGAKACT